MRLKLNYLDTTTDDKLGAKQTQHLFVKWIGGGVSLGEEMLCCIMSFWQLSDKHSKRRSPCVNISSQII